MTVALCELGFRRLARNRRGAWWHDDCGAGITIDGGTINAILIISAIAGERGDRPHHLVKQRSYPGGIIHVVRCQFSGDPSGAEGAETPSAKSAPSGSPAVNTMAARRGSCAERLARPQSPSR
jgi:hypothetical protein